MRIAREIGGRGMTDWYDEYYDDVVIDRYGIHVDALKKRGLFKKEFLTRKKKRPKEEKE